MTNQVEIHRKSMGSKVKARREALRQLSDNFAVLPDKTQAWNDLIRLTMDQFSTVRIVTNYSLGRTCIFTATETESKEDFRKKLESALTFFLRNHQ